MKPRNSITTSLASLSLAAPLLGQTNAPSSPRETTVFDRVVVEGVPLEELIVPTARPFSSVYGTDRSILDTPRNVTIISRAQLDAISIKDVRDFSKLTSSSYTRSNFGAPTTPDIRTQIADTYSNGMRIGLSSNGNGLPVNFNSVESVNIVKGPATAVYGPSQYVGGYIDYITKKPFFDKFQGSVFGEVGMYDQYRWGTDFGGPISKTQAYRISYSGEDSGSYYGDGFKKTEAGYGAYSWIPNDTYELALNAEYFWGNYTENFGINRVTQELIDDGIYQTGTNINGGTSASAADPQNAKNVVSGFPTSNTIGLGPKVKIDRALRTLKPGDDSEGHSVNLQAIQTVKLSDSATIANNTFYRYVDRETYSSYYYSEIIDPSWSVENRTEVRLDLEKHKINTGLSLRYQEVTAYNDFFFEPANAWDLTKDHNFIDITRSDAFIASTKNGDRVAVPGWAGRYYTPYNGDSGHSEALTVAPFIQEDWHITEKLSALAGGRIDVLSTRYQDPAGYLKGDSTVVGLPNGNGSLIYKWTPEFSTYGTYNYSQNPVGATGNGGGITTAGNADYSNAILRNEAMLYELGAKQTLFGNRLFLNFALFQQDRADLQQDRSIVKFLTRGVEFEANYQPNRNLFLTFGYSYMDSTVNQPQFDVGNTSLTPASDRFFTMDPADAPYRRQGVPAHLMNLLVSYKFDNGFGASANLVFTSEINNNVKGTLVIPAQYSLDLSAFYTHKRFEARLSALNATDEKNWSAPNAVYGNESIIADLPFRLEGRVTLKF